MPLDELAQAVWRKSARSGEQGACVEVAAVTTSIAVRDSKNPAGPALRFDRAIFAALVGRIRAGHLDL